MIIADMLMSPRGYPSADLPNLQEFAIQHEGLSGIKMLQFLRGEDGEGNGSDVPGQLHGAGSCAFLGLVVADAVNALDSVAW